MQETTDKISNLKRQDGHTLAYAKLDGRDSARPGVIFLSGFKSDMQGSKALFLETFCRREGLSYLRFDYFGHGQSSGAFTDGSLSRWLEDTLAALDELTKGPQIIIGSSMGGWLMLLAALKRPKRLHALLGIASAPDFTENLIWNALKPEEQKTILDHGVFHLPTEYCNDPAADSSYPITRLLIEDGRNHLLLGTPIPITCPVRLIHGMKDADVPPDVSLQILNHLASNDATATFLKSGDHRMSSPEALTLLEKTLVELMG
jgi:pimeloyl-ACP methyl ester carboxylesterase